MRVHAKNFYDDITLHNVSLEVYISNYPNITKYWVNLVIINTPPKFALPLADKEMGLYWKKSYTLPEFSDPDDGPVSFKWDMIPKMDFIKYEPATNTFMFNPMEVKMVGEFTIIVTLTDYQKGIYSEKFTLRVHRPPMFTTQMKKLYSMKVGSELILDLPLYETDEIGISHSSLPGFAIHDTF